MITVRKEKRVENLLGVSVKRQLNRMASDTDALQSAHGIKKHSRHAALVIPSEVEESLNVSEILEMSRLRST
jgi:hypothetical protein